MVAALVMVLIIGVDDPGVINLSIPPQWAMVGEEWLLIWDTTIEIDGAWGYTVDWSLTPTPDSGPTAAADGLTWTPTDAGDYLLDVEFLNGAVHVANITTTLHVADAGIALSGNVSVFGDSISAYNLWQTHLATSEPSLSWLGTRGTEAGLLKDSISGWTWSAWMHSSGSTMSPLTCGSDAYCSTAGTPDVIVWAAGTNDASQSGTVAARNAVLANLDSLIAQWVGYENTVHIVWTPPPGADNDVPFIANYAGTPMEDQWYWEQRQRSMSRSVISHYAGRESERIYVAATATGVDTANDYPSDNALHPATSGYQHIAKAIRAVIAAAKGY